jgi:hypothetical protein
VDSGQWTVDSGGKERVTNEGRAGGAPATGATCHLESLGLGLEGAGSNFLEQFDGTGRTASANGEGAKGPGGVADNSNCTGSSSAFFYYEPDGASGCW